MNTFGEISTGPRGCFLAADEISQVQVGWVDSGRLQGHGKSNRSKVPSDGHRSNSAGKLYAFPPQCSSDSGRVALRLSRPLGLCNAKIFACPCRCPLSTHPTCTWLISGIALAE
ncbi:MAG: hypothetical protein KHZ73_06830 [Lachnospiraceae bacterium]|nr:hypothetical protein [Lachnospiraceae bacterium]